MGCVEDTSCGGSRVALSIERGAREAYREVKREILARDASFTDKQ